MPYTRTLTAKRAARKHHPAPYQGAKQPQQSDAAGDEADHGAGQAPDAQTHYDQTSANTA